MNTTVVNLDYEYYDVPAEIVMEKPSLANNLRWCWSICQPNSNWGVYESGTHWDRAQAAADAHISLIRVHRTQNLK